MRWTEADLRGRAGIRGVNGHYLVAPTSRSKMGNEPTIVDGIKFQSKLEARYYQDLKLQWRQGYLYWFTRQVPFWLEGNVKYIADFLAVRTTGIQVIDTSGHLTRIKINKLKQMLDRYGISVQIVFKDGSIKTIADIARNVPRDTERA